MTYQLFTQFLLLNILAAFAKADRSFGTVEPEPRTQSFGTNFDALDGEGDKKIEEYWIILVLLGVFFALLFIVWGVYQLCRIAAS